MRWIGKLRSMPRLDKIGAVLLVVAVVCALFCFPWFETVPCLRQGTPDLIAATIASDTGIAAAYIRIPIRLVALWRRMKARPTAGLLVATGAFVLACGGTHIASIVMFALPYYWLSMKLKAVTAAISLAVSRMLDHEEQAILKLSDQNAELARERDEARRARDEAETQRRRAKNRALQRREALQREAEKSKELERVAGERQEALERESAMAAQLREQLDAAERLARERQEALDLAERQQRTIAGLTVPIIEAEPRILLLPLVGVLDSERAALAMDALLSTAAAGPAVYGVLDMTGIDVVETATAAHLLHMIVAARLIGLQVVFSGIRPRVAQTMTALGIDLAQARTFKTLGDGLAWARRALGKETA